MVNFEKLCMIEQITGKKYPSSLTPEQENLLASMMQRREQGEPLQYILGEWEFYGLKIFVGKGVLIPRPETELLVDTVLHFAQNQKNLKILDLCTGSGCIALALKNSFLMRKFPLSIRVKSLYPMRRKIKISIILKLTCFMTVC